MIKNNVFDWQSFVLTTGGFVSISTFLNRESTVAKPHFNRWLVPPAALSIHLAIGQAYGFSVFNLPMTKLIGITESAPDDWKLSTLGWIFSLAIVFLGLSAAFGGTWVERAGPRKAMLASAVFFSVGFLVSSFGISIHSLPLVYLGYGVIGGIGLGLGYMAPVKTLITWFPDRPGMATGLAIMGFGGGAMIGSPLAITLMNHFKTATSLGVAETFATMGVLYFFFMMWGVLTIRVPAKGWIPDGYVPSQKVDKMITKNNVSAQNAIKTPQFYFLWFVLFLNVTAGIGVLGQASAMSQEMFKNRITPAAAAGFVGLLSIFNMAGRFFWSSASDYIGRRPTYMIYFALGAVLYYLVPLTGQAQNIFLFVAVYAVILSMYGAGFATIPAYLSDIFGKAQVSAIHGRLLTAWSAAGIAGPALVNYIREYQISQGVPPADSYSFTMYLMAGLLVIGFICNFMVKPVAPKYYSPELSV
ncbi:MAG: OFA family MFS transporter [Bdellovibrio sp.]|nr:OFA family MFS transporter [Bdellovibrio sp.]